MIKFILRRIVLMIPLVLGITMVAFGVMQLAPGDYLDPLRGQPQIRPETIEALRRDYGLDRPWYQQYVLWLWNVLQGKFGYSFTYKIGVFELIGQRVYYTVLLSIYATLFAWFLGVPLGIYIATHRNGWVDRVANFLAFSDISLPGFFVALLAVLWAQTSGFFPLGGATSVEYEQMSWLGKVKDTAWHLVLPVLVLGTRGIAGLMRQMRGNMLDVLGENYILAARARGLAERKVILKHALRSSINPLITLFGFEISGLLAGAALVEYVMSWPGLGQLLLSAVQTQDLYVAMGAFLMGAVLLIIGNLIADVLLAVSDPRIKISQ